MHKNLLDVVPQLVSFCDPAKRNSDNCGKLQQMYNCALNHHRFPEHLVVKQSSLCYNYRRDYVSSVGALLKDPSPNRTEELLTQIGALSDPSTAIRIQTEVVNAMMNPFK